MYSPELLTAEEAAQTLRQSKRTLLRWRNQRVGPPSVKVGHRVLYRRADLELWLEGCLVESVAEREAS